MKTAKFVTSKKSATRLGPLLNSILARMGLGHAHDGWRMVNLWPEIVGDKIADRSKAIRYENDTLFVSVPDAVWRQELLLDVDRILQEIHTIPGGRSVKKIHFIA